MITGFLGLLSAGLAIAAIVIWMRLIQRVEIGERRRGVTAMLVGAIVLGVAAFTGQPGLLAGSLAGFGVLIGAIYLGLLALAGQSRQTPAVAVGSALPDFGAPDHEGRRFELASLKGHPVLLKFFRGHW